MEKELHMIRKFKPKAALLLIQQQWILPKDIYVAINEDLSPNM